MTPAVLTKPMGQSPRNRNYVVSEINQLGGIKGRMVVTQDYKYMLFDDGENREQLFDRANDPGEMKPVTYDLEYRTQLLAHRDMLLDWGRKIGDLDFQPVGKFPELPAAGE
jgi:hypothetical protein